MVVGERGWERGARQARHEGGFKKGGLRRKREQTWKHIRLSGYFWGIVIF